MSHLDRQNRAPKVSVLADLRLRVEEVWDVLDFEAKTQAKFLSDVEIPWGTPNDQFPIALLVSQNLTGQGENPNKSPNDPPPQLVRVYEQIDPLLETKVGNSDVSFDQYGRKTVVEQSLQFSSNAPTYLVVGTTAAPAPNAACILKSEERTNDGTLQRITRTYIDSGELSDNEQLKFGGRLLLRELTYLNQVPPTPSGWTLITQSIEFIQGLPVYKYGYANGSAGAGAGGEISRDVEYSQSSDQGTTGVTKTVIRYIVAPGGSQLPATLAGSVLIGASVEHGDGFDTWTTTWAKGTGTVSTTNETKDNGALLIRTIIALGSAPATPGGYTLFSTQVREEAGYQIFAYSFALGTGQISQTDDTKYDGALLLRTIRYLSVPGASNPIATPSGYTAVNITYEEADGHKIWNGAFAKGTGQISLTIDYEVSPDGGVTGITRQTIKYISTPSVVVNPITPPGGYVLVSTDRVDSDGFAIWTAMYASGTGVIASDTEIRENGKLYIYTKTSLNAVPSAPAATIGGTVVLIKNAQRNGTRIENGNIVYDRTWAEGNGQVATHIVTRQDGLREVTFISIGTRVAPVGNLVRDDSQEESGYTLYTVSAMQTAAGGASIAGVVSVSFGAIEEFEYPGRIKPFVAITGAFKALDAYMSPPIRTKIAATVLITYQTSSTLTLANTLWAPTDAAAMYSQWVGTNGVQHNLVKSYPGYRYVSGGTANLTSTDNVHFSIFNQPIIAGNNATITMTGGPVDPGGNTYCLRAHLEPAFTDTAGTIYYRKTEIYATIPTQTALPV